MILVKVSPLLNVEKTASTKDKVQLMAAKGLIKADPHFQNFARFIVITLVFNKFPCA